MPKTDPARRRRDGEIVSLSTIGPDAVTDLIVAATPEQLAAVLDADLWRPHHAGGDDTFDVSRFGEWLEAFAAAGEDDAARLIASIDPDLLITGFAQHIRVVDIAALLPTAMTDDEVFEPRIPGGPGPSCEIGGYHVRARRIENWDAAVAVLTALDAHHPERFHALMRGCRRLSDEGRETDGLDDLLDPQAQQTHDVAIARESRRVDRGYLAPADARAYLEMARSRNGAQGTGIPSSNPIASGYLRAVRDRDGAERPSPEPADLAAFGVVAEGPRALLTGATSDRSEPLLIQKLMASVERRDVSAFLLRGQELAFLANALAAGSSLLGRSFTPDEASDAAVRTCNLGLELWPDARSDSFLIEHDLLAPFEAAWSALHQDVNVFAADRLLRTLGDLDSVDPDVRRGLRSLERALRTQRERGTPWRAREAMDVLAMLDLPAWASLLGLFDECPVLPDALVATLEGRTGAISATAFTFFATPAHIHQAQAFLSRLLDLLSR